MNELRLIAPYSFLTSLYSPVPALLILKYGGSAKNVGIIAAISTLTSLLASIFWPKYVKEGNKGRITSLGYLGMFLASFLLLYPKWIYIAAALMYFFNSAVYYAAMSSLKSKEGSLNQKIKELQASNQFWSILGILTGALLTIYFPPESVALAVATLSLLSISLAAPHLGEEGILGVMEEGLNELEKMDLNVKRLSPKTKLIKDYAMFLLTSFLFSLGFGTIYSQLVTFVKFYLKENYLIYVLSFIASFFQLISFKIKLEINEIKALITGYLLRLVDLGLLLIATKIPNIWLIVMFYALSGFSWGLFILFYNLTGLRVDEELLGANLAVRSIAYLLGSLVSGFLIDSFGFTLTFLLGFLFVLLAPFPYLSHAKSH